MLIGLALRGLGWPFKLVFTSAAQRHHTWITRFLIARMDGVIGHQRGVGVLSQAARDRRTPWRRHVGLLPAGGPGGSVCVTGLPGRYAIGCFGRVRPQKGTDLFVEAMCTLLPKYPDYMAVIVGAIDGRGFADALEARVRAAGLAERIRILGERPIAELPHWYQRVSIYAFTSRNEGFGLTLIEAMAASTALVATRAGAAETVVVDGERSAGADRRCGSAWSRRSNR